MDNNYEKYSDIAEILKALSHPVRLCIVTNLLKKGECTVGYMQNCLDMPQSTVSQHIQKLKSAGIIKGERNGVEIKYSVVNDSVIKIIDSLFSEN